MRDHVVDIYWRMAIVRHDADNKNSEGASMARPSVIPHGCWPAVLRDELAAGYAGEKTVEAFLSRVGTVWPKPFIETGSGKGKFRAWRKIDLDKAIGGNVGSPDLEAW
ncbi:hypothetical protein [Rhizobium leguminosarum]|uniref:hypothetical protein n=1 Tax=Rhizobium leguminosarum TaxID=384 RepID=UPI003F9B590E